MTQDHLSISSDSTGNSPANGPSNENDLDKIDDTARENRLNFLYGHHCLPKLIIRIEKSKIYATILAEKLTKQQQGLKTANPSTTTPKTRKRSNKRSSGPHDDGSSRQPALITGVTMREYQLAGLEWMVSLYENGLNGILADEMGLGKTLQTIAFLAFLRGKGVYGPFLVAAPLSTLANWVNEIERFAPDVPVLLYHGTKTERTELRSSLGKLGPEFPIVITSYEIVMNDRKHLARYSWKYIVVDEGHRLKNLNCKLIRELKQYTSANRLLLTGTPLQNNLAELWSLLNFLLPDIFSDLESFQSWFDLSSLADDNVEPSNRLKAQTEKSVITALHQILKPFLLRRLKTDVEKDLPPKREYLLYAPMTTEQAGLYRAILSKNVQAYLEGRDPATTKSKPESNGRRVKKRKIDYADAQDDDEFEQEADLPQDVVANAQDDATKHIKLRNLLMSLRKACNHPYQFYWPVKEGTDELIVDDSIAKNSGKMLLLGRLLEALLKNGHKVLIFSQFTVMLDIIEVWAEDVLGLKISRIDGNVSQEDRRSSIDEFNKDPDRQVFLLSTRAGGLGINLTAADTVILYDSDWNPQSDLQAMDRVHRIGQKRPVIVYRLVSRDTIESRIIEKADFKRRLERVVIEKGKFKTISAQSATNKEALEHLQEILESEEVQHINIETAGDEVISDADLAVILDRSERAYERTEHSSSVFQALGTKRDLQNDSLATPA